jgi:predicted small metal-binding protein
LYINILVCVIENQKLTQYASQNNHTYTKVSGPSIVINKCLEDKTSSAVNMKTITCREAGFECDYVVKGETEEEVMKRGAEHVMKDHGMKEADITPEFKEKVRGLIRTT